MLVRNPTSASYRRMRSVLSQFVLPILGRSHRLYSIKVRYHDTEQNHRSRNPKVRGSQFCKSD